MAFLLFYLPLFVLVPTLVGLIRFKTLDDGHRLFFYYLVLTSLFQITNIFTIEVTVKTKIHYCCYGVSFILLFQILHHWAISYRWKMIFSIISIICPLIIFTEFVIRFQTIKIPSYGMLFISFIFCISALPILVKYFSHGTLVPWEKSIVLILVPLIITFFIGSILQFNYAVVYSPSTHHLFSKAFFIMRFLQLLSYFSFSIAMLWAPRKEIFI
jgi:hypothetical protein